MSVNHRLHCKFICFPGVKKDGSKKVRSVDHMTQSMVNASTSVKESMKHDNLDFLFEIMRRLKSDSWESIALFKVATCLDGCGIITKSYVARPVLGRRTSTVPTAGYRYGRSTGTMPR